MSKVSGMERNSLILMVTFPMILMLQYTNRLQGIQVNNAEDLEIII